jgi:predicted nucleic acid-binding protein
MVVLDSWAIMRLLEGSQPAADRVQHQLDEGAAVMSWINLGEVFYVLRRVVGEKPALETVRDIESVVNVLVPDRATVLDAARIKSEHRMAYADSFAAATAVRQSAPLWTGDPELLVSGAPWKPFDPSQH